MEKTRTSEIPSEELMNMLVGFFNNIPVNRNELTPAELEKLGVLKTQLRLDELCAFEALGVKSLSEMDVEIEKLVTSVTLVDELESEKRKRLGSDELYDKSTDLENFLSEYALSTTNFQRYILKRYKRAFVWGRNQDQPVALPFLVNKSLFDGGEELMNNERKAFISLIGTQSKRPVGEARGLVLSWPREFRNVYGEEIILYRT